MHRLAFHARISTSWSLIGKYSANGRSITTTTFLAAKASTTRPSTRTKTKKMSGPIDLTQDSSSDESDEDLKLAIAMSLSLPENSNDSTSPKPTIRDEPKPVFQPITTGIMGLDRKKMEEERLARKAQLKRKRGDEDRPIPISPPPLSRQTRPRSPPRRPSPLKTPPAETTKGTTATPPQPASPSSSSSTPPKPRSTLQYPNGTIKRTWISSHLRTDRDITFSELIDAPNLKSALLSSFIWEFDWLFPHFRTKETKFVLVMHAQNAQHISHLKADFGSIPNIRLVFPTTSGIGCMHSKLLLFFYASHVRIAIPTANLTSFDWGECGRLENMLFVIDLPPLESPRDDTIAEQNSRYPFYTSLMQFLSAQSAPADVLARVSAFDFGATLANNVAFVHSIGGTHTDPDVLASTGRCGLGSAISRMGLAPRRAEGESIEIDYMSSSVGSLREDFLAGLFKAACGGHEVEVRRGNPKMLPDTSAVKLHVQDGGIEAFFNPPRQNHGTSRDTDDEVTDDETRGINNTTTTTTTKKMVSNPSPLPAPATWSTNLRIFFPSAHTIATSLGGPAGAGTICFQRRWWEGSKFPRSVLRDCVAVRQGVLMHSKVMFVRFVGLKKKEEEEQRGQGEYAGWVYVGSANCSESAWGVLGGVGKRKVKVKAGTGTGTKSKKGGGDVDGDSTGNVRLTCRNWECGVVLPVPVPVQGGKTGLDVFDPVLSVPMVYPGTRYEGNSGLEPWFFGEDDTAAS